MFYTVYRVINLCNGKEYIGKHQTDNLEDGYMGSGKWLKRAIQKYGPENFKKEILHVFDTEQEMNDKEAELVSEEYCDRKDTYNICVGGKGGFSYINKTRNHKEHNTNLAKKRDYSLTDRTAFKTDEYRERMRKSSKKLWEEGICSFIPSTKGMKYSEDHCKKISIANTGKGNSQYGTMWITNGTENKKIKKELDKIPEGWYKGRCYGNGRAI